MRRMLTVTNDFHRTEARIRGVGPLSAAQIRRIRRELCGVEGCTCGGPLGERGPQTVEIEEVPGGINVYPREVES